MVGDLTISIGNHFLSRPSSDFSDNKNTKGGNSTPDKTFDSNNRQTQMSEFNYSEALQKMEDWSIYPGTEQDDKKRVDLGECCLSSSTLSGSGSNAIEATGEKGQIKVF